MKKNMDKLISNSMCFCASMATKWAEPHAPWRRSSTCLCGPGVFSCTLAADARACLVAPPSGKTSLIGHSEREACQFRGFQEFNQPPTKVRLIMDLRLPLPGGMAAHWCLMSRAHAVWRTGSTKMSALLSFSRFSTSCKQQG